MSSNELTVTETSLRGLFIITLAVHEDSRGSFREAYQAEKLEALGLPKLGPVQMNISENIRAGIIRGIHAEPWDKLIHVLAGEVCNIAVDLRPDSPTFGQHQSFTLNQSNALFISKGFGNAFQVLKAPVSYGYLVNKHWSSGEQYTNVRFDDPDLGIVWPLAVTADDVSDKDRNNQLLREVFPEKFLLKA